MGVPMNMKGRLGGKKKKVSAHDTRSYLQRTGTTSTSVLYTGELTSCNLAMFYSKLHLCLEQPQTPSTCSRHVELEVRGGEQ